MMPRALNVNIDGVSFKCILDEGDRETGSWWMLDLDGETHELVPAKDCPDEGALAEQIRRWLCDTRRIEP